MELREIGWALRRWWWLALLVPALTGAILVVRAVRAPYQSTLRATVLIPGDTEIPGSAERPELMVLDDLPALISSRVFAEAVVRQDPALDVDGTQRSLSGSRYSRVLTVTATNPDKQRASAIARAAQVVLPQAVNDNLVAAAGAAATVRIIDPAGTATRDRAGRLQIMLAQLLVAAAVGVGLAVLADAVRRPAASASSPAS